MTLRLPDLRRSAFITFVAATVAAGCADTTRSRAQADSTAASRAAPAASGAGAPAETTAAYPFRWDLLGVKRALAGEALAFRQMGAVTQPFMTVRGTAFKVGAAELQVFIYGDVGAAMRDVTKLDTARVSPPTMMIDWVAKPSVLVANNLAAIIVTDDEGLRQRIKDALTVRTHGGPRVLGDTNFPQ